MNYEDLASLLDRDALAAFRAKALNPEHPVMRSTVQNPDIYFQLRESNNTAYAELPDIVEDYMAQISKLTGREYHLFNYYGAPDAEEVVVAMCSVTEALRETVDYLNSRGRKVGVVQIAGLVARRIVCFARVGQTLRMGDRFGLIRFGSRLDVYLPAGVAPLVAVGQTAVAGETVLADLTGSEPERGLRRD